MQNKVVAIILARGGSKGIPRKNVLNFVGHPLVAWSVMQAKKTKEIDEVYVSSDSDEILEIASENNLQVYEDSAQALGAKYKGEFGGINPDIPSVPYAFSAGITILAMLPFFNVIIDSSIPGIALLLPTKKLKGFIPGKYELSNMQPSGSQPV